MLEHFIIAENGLFQMGLFNNALWILFFQKIQSEILHVWQSEAVDVWITLLTWWPDYQRKVLICSALPSWVSIFWRLFHLYLRSFHPLYCMVCPVSILPCRTAESSLHMSTGEMSHLFLNIGTAIQFGLHHRCFPICTGMEYRRFCNFGRLGQPRRILHQDSNKSALYM